MQVFLIIKLTLGWLIDIKALFFTSDAEVLLIRKLSAFFYLKTLSFCALGIDVVDVLSAFFTLFIKNLWRLFMKRFFHVGCLLLILWGCIDPSYAAENLIKVKAGHLVALDMAPLFVAKESGCFKRYGLDVETVFFSNPGDNNAALAGGKIDFSTNPFTLPFFAANSGVPINVISAAGGWGVMEVVAQGKLKLNSMADVKTYITVGRPKLKVGTLQGDTLELILTRALDQEGIAQSAVEYVYFNDLLAMVEAFKAGQIDILSHIKPYTTDLVKNKGATILTSNAKVWTVKTPNCVVSVLDKTYTQRPEVVKAYLQGLQCGADIINKNPQAAVNLLSQGNYYKVPADVLVQAFQSAPALIGFEPDLEAIQSVINDLTKMGYVKGQTSAREIFHLDILNQVTNAK